MRPKVPSTGLPGNAKFLTFPSLCLSFPICALGGFNYIIFSGPPLALWAYALWMVGWVPLSAPVPVFRHGHRGQKSCHPMNTLQSLYSFLRWIFWLCKPVNLQNPLLKISMNLLRRCRSLLLEFLIQVSFLIVEVHFTTAAESEKPGVLYACCLLAFENPFRGVKADPRIHDEKVRKTFNTPGPWNHVSRGWKNLHTLIKDIPGSWVLVPEAKLLLLA